MQLSFLELYFWANWTWQKTLNSTEIRIQKIFWNFLPILGLVCAWLNSGLGWAGLCCVSKIIAKRLLVSLEKSWILGYIFFGECLLPFLHFFRWNYSCLKFVRLNFLCKKRELSFLLVAKASLLGQCQNYSHVQAKSVAKFVQLSLLYYGQNELHNINIHCSKLTWSSFKALVQFWLFKSQGFENSFEIPVSRLSPRSEVCKTTWF